MDGCQGSLQEQWHPDYHQEGYFEVTAQGKRLFPTTMAPDGHILLDYIPTTKMAADGLTKSLGGEKHSKFLYMLGLKPHLSGSVKNR